jgi:hypothetical protein
MFLDLVNGDTLDRAHGEIRAGCRVALRMCANLGLDADDCWPYFARPSLADAWKEYRQLKQLPEWQRQRDLLERDGSDGRVEGRKS